MKSAKMQTREISKKIGIALFLVTTFVFIYVSFNVYQNKNPVITLDDNFYETGNMIDEYIIYNSKCKIPKLKPWGHDTIQAFVKEKYVNCSNLPLLTHITKNKTHAVLSIRQDVMTLYSSGNISCCFSYVERGNTTEPDNDIRVSTCIYFEDEVVLNKNIVTVQCYNGKVKIYENVHAFSFPYAHVLNGKREYEEAKRPPSVLFIGIDSVSRLSMLRVLKNTHDFLEANDWVGYQAYNKIDLNTFPNMIAVLTGLELDQLDKICNPYLGLLNKCEMLWGAFEKVGYVTAYAEDFSILNTFNYYRKGFRKQPTSFYFRAYSVAMDRLSKDPWETYCSGPETSGERILNLAVDFASTFKNRPSFGFFWMSSFSHDSWTMPRRLDDRIVQFLRHIEREGILKNTIVIFLSDHGSRFGKSRASLSGWFEERLPFLYFWLPLWFRRKYPTETMNLNTNSKRLTTPYDLHMTLQHLMVLSGLNHTIKQSLTCPNCRSLFQEIEEVRSCKEASIKDRWCACNDVQPYSTFSRLSKTAAAFVIKDLLAILSKYDEVHGKCSNFVVKKVLYSSVAESNETVTREFTLAFETIPHALFEATISLDFRDEEPVFRPLYGPFRLDSYSRTSTCTRNEYLRTLCYCL